MPKSYQRMMRNGGGNRNQKNQGNVEDALDLADGEVKRWRIVMARF